MPQGGNFDGAAGVVAGLIVLAGLKEEGCRPRRTLRLYGLRGEESARFGKAYVGSSALFGKLSADDLAVKATDSDRTLGECMREVGVDVDRVKNSQPLADPKTFAAWLELHIEQGPVLVARNLPVGIVTGIRGNIRHRLIECVGTAGPFRRRPAMASARCDVRHGGAYLAPRPALAYPSGKRTGLGHHDGGRDDRPPRACHCPHPRTLRFSFELRSQSKETLEAFYDLFLSECRLVGDERGVEFRLDRRLESAPAIMDPKWVGRLKAVARGLGLPDEEIPSGAGHDAAVFANEGIPSAMVFVRNEHGSHNPDEAMEMADFLAGVAIMREALKEAAA